MKIHRQFVNHIRQTGILTHIHIDGQILKATVGLMPNKCTMLVFLYFCWILVEKSSAPLSYNSLQSIGIDCRRNGKVLFSFYQEKGKGKGMPKDYYIYISFNMMGNLKEMKQNE